MAITTFAVHHAGCLPGYLVPGILALKSDTAAEYVDCYTPVPRSAGRLCAGCWEQMGAVTPLSTCTWAWADHGEAL